MSITHRVCESGSRSTPELIDFLNDRFAPLRLRAVWVTRWTGLCLITVRSTQQPTHMQGMHVGVVAICVYL